MLIREAAAGAGTADLMDSYRGSANIAPSPAPLLRISMMDSELFGIEERVATGSRPSRYLRDSEWRECVP